jgi:hypothetical protein
LNTNLKNSPILNAIEPSDASPIQMTFTFQSLYQLQGLSINNEVNQKIPQRNRFGAAFSVAKTAVNIALNNNKDGELIQLLKKFIAEQQENHDNTYYVTDDNIAEQSRRNDSELVVLQENLIDQTTNHHVTRIRGAPCKRRMKNGIEIYKTNRIPMQENTNEFNQTKEDNQTGRSQRKCLLCGRPGHYQKKCPNCRK